MKAEALRGHLDALILAVVEDVEHRQRPPAPHLPAECCGL
jgi:hypothetical protein